MTLDDKSEQPRSNSGLCSNCVNSRRIESARGSVFILCQLSATDPRFPKYPRLPVLSCAGYLMNAPSI
jgi:hypothetical protein